MFSLICFVVGVVAGWLGHAFWPQEKAAISEIADKVETKIQDEIKQ